MKYKDNVDTFQRQMSAIIAKLLNDIENLQTIRNLHPFDLNRLRRRCIDAAWDAYVVGLNKGKNEDNLNEYIHSSEHRAVNS